MKSIFVLFTTILLSLNLFSQVPDKINYQAIIRDTNGNLIRNKQIRMKISILLNSDTGSPVYAEIHDAESNENGLVSLEIGNGRTTDVFTAIDWSTGIYFLKTETDPEGNSNFTITGTSQILSVPYAFHAQTVENDKVDDADADPNNEIQTLSISGNDLTISDGNTVALPAGSTSPWQRSGNDIFYYSGNVAIGLIGSSYSALAVNALLTTAIYGTAQATTGETHGGEFESMSTSGIGVMGVARALTGNTYGGSFYSASPTGVGVSGFAMSQSSIGMGGKFYSSGILGKGVLGVADATSGVNYGGVFASKSTSGTGVFGEAEATTGINYGGKFKTRSATGYSGYFEGGKFFVDGNTGIGTDNPEQLLHLAGANPRILIEASSSNPEVNFKNDGDIPTSIWSIYKNGSTGDLHFYQNGNKLTLQKNTGNVGIGTSTPQGRLDVNGAIYQRGGVLHADYVFEADYQLESIEEHARFMWKNKHLPAIPKATTDDNGDEIVEVGSHRKGIVEELEKAHIYISQLEKAIQEQATLIKNQESRLEQLEVLVKKSMSN